MSNKKYTKEMVIDYFLKFGCKLLTEFENVVSPLEYICECGEIVKTNFDSFRRSKYKRCRKCISTNFNGNSTINIDIVRKYFKEQGCELLEEVYVNSKTKMKYICICGNEDLKTWNHFKKGQRCKKCGIEKFSNNQKLKYKDIKQFFKDHDCELLELEYEDIHTPLKHLCSCGEIIYKSFATFKENPKCTCNCKNIPKRKGVRYTDNELIDIFWEFLQKNNRYLTPSDLKSDEYLPSSNAYYRFGKWNDFLNQLGLLGSDGWYICDEEVLKSMYGKCDKQEIINALMVKRKWQSIKGKAGKLNLKMKKYYTDDELLDIVREFHKNNNKNPSISDFKNIEPNYYVYKNRFNGWNNVLKLAGLTVKENVSFTKEDINKIIDDYVNGKTAKEIANKYSVSDTRIHYELRKNNISIRTNKWSDDKILKLKELYPMSSWGLILKELSPFRKEDIIAKAYKLNIKRDCYGYSEDEEQILLDNYGKVTFKTIKSLLPNKSDASIMTKANKLGLIMMEKWSEDEINKLIHLYPFYTNEELVEFFPNRTSTAIMSMATMKLNLNKNEVYLSEKYYKREKERMLKELIEFSNELGRTPTTEEVQENKKLSGIASYHRIFGSYSEACKLAGLEVNANIFGSPTHYLSKNGDVCLSKKELEITNLLIDNNILYKKEVLYRDILKDDELSYIRCDWLIDNILVVEYFGLPEKEFYKIKMNDKIKLCEENKIPFIDLYIKDTRNKFKGLIDKFSQYGIKIVI